MASPLKQEARINGRHGTVFWFTGLAGAGKTTIGKLFYRRLKKNRQNAVFLDGDVLRRVFDSPLDHSLAHRRKIAARNARLCKVLSDQGIHVVCATISLFRALHAWNRAHIRNYREIFVRAPMKVLIKRDAKKLYSRALRGKIRNVMGIDLPAEEPKNPDAIIDNDGTQTPASLARFLFSAFEDGRL
ncbi:MAG: adenylyl-sulfate kinase [Deltaproteobacteria bacterium]|nr:adenylyl-sulfate kinase [Deltaproteobacteria bacterium]